MELVSMELKLSKKDLKYLEEFSRKGNRKARSLKRANILLLSNKRKSETAIATILGASRATVYNVKNRYRSGGLATALEEKPRSGQPRKYGEKKTAEIIAIACTFPPEGRKRWTVRLIADTLCQKRGFETLNRESVRLVLKKAKRALG